VRICTLAWSDADEEQELAAIRKPDKSEDRQSKERQAGHLTWTDGASTSHPKLMWVPLVSIALVALAVEIPFFFRGTPSGHDFEFHLYSWLEVLSQWKAGIVFPRWAALANFAYGEPTFVFYPPASWTLGAFLSAIFPWVVAPSLYIWLALVGAGTSMFMLARQWLDRRDATFAAVLYAVNPYHLVIVYWRSAFAELLASSLLPLLLLLVLRAGEKAGKASRESRATWLWLAVVLASAWLVNAPAAVMIHYSLALLVVVVALERRSARVLLIGGSAVVLGAALVAFYLLPAAYEQKWVNIGEAVSAGYRPSDNFFFAHTDDPAHDAFNRVISWIAIGEIVATAGAAWAARRLSWQNRTLWYGLVAWAVACAVLMVSISNPVWEALPELRFMQFPWRWMLCLGVPFTLLVTVGVRRWFGRIAIYLALICVVGFVWRHYQPPWWDTAADLREMQGNITAGVGYEGVDEYVPAGADASSIDNNAPRVTVNGPARAVIRVFRWSPEEKSFTADMPDRDELRLRLFNYPAWKVEVNGQTVRTGAEEETGQMLVPVDAGMNRVEIRFVQTWDRRLGASISVCALILLIGMAGYEIRRSQITSRIIPQIRRNERCGEF
jgi:hypothetical protein